MLNFCLGKQCNALQLVYYKYKVTKSSILNRRQATIETFPRRALAGLICISIYTLARCKSLIKQKEIIHFTQPWG